MKSNNPLYESRCCEAGGAHGTVSVTDIDKPSPDAAYLTGSLLLVAVWFAIYSNLVIITDQITHFFSRILGFSMTGNSANPSPFSYTICQRFSCC